MNLVIVGGAGFLGGSIARYWLETYPKDTITIIDDFSTSDPTSLADINGRRNVNVITGSITDHDIISSNFATKTPDVIINSVDAHDAHSAYHSFVEGTHNLMTVLTEQNLQPKFIHISTDEVYGDTITADGTLKNAEETDALRPHNLISAAQASADLLLNAAFTDTNFPVVIVRPSNVYGPHMKDRRLLTRLITHALNNENIPVYGNGTHMRDWLYVNDFVTAIEQIIKIDLAKIPSPPILNLASELPHTILEVVEIILTILNKPKELIDFVTDNAPNMNRKVLDADKARNFLDWNPTTDLNSGLSETINWFKSKLNK